MRCDSDSYNNEIEVAKKKCTCISFIFMDISPGIVHASLNVMFISVAVALNYSRGLDKRFLFLLYLIASLCATDDYKEYEEQ